MEAEKLTYKQIIKKYLAYLGGYVEGYRLSKVDTPYGWIGASGERRCRELAEAGEIEKYYKTIKNKKYAYYKALERQK